MRRHAIVTVVFEAEVPLLWLQARSLSLLASPDLIDEVVVLDNTRAGLAPVDVDRLTEAARPHPIRFLRADDVCPAPGASGWRRQQLLKLFAAEHLRAERYLVLDAKNHLVAPLADPFLEDRAGRPRLTAYSFATHPLRPALEHTLRFMDLDPAPRIEHYTAAVTPFVLETAEVRRMLDDVGDGSPTRFVRRFLRHDLTEFFLCSAWREAQGENLEEIFDLSRPGCPTVWPATAGDEAAVSEVLEHADQPFFAVHRRALSRFSPATADRLCAFWSDRALFGSADEAATWFDGAVRTAADAPAAPRWERAPQRAWASAARWITTRVAAAS